jgi:hypothetical protein
MTLHLTAVTAKDGAGTTIPGGIQQNDTSGTGAGPNIPTLHVLDSTKAEILGTTADAKNSATDTTAISVMSVLKQISASIQAAAKATKNSPQSPNVTASAYAASNGIGGIITFSNVLDPTTFTGILQSITAKFKGSAPTAPLQITFFSASPSNGTYGDHATPTWNAADMANLIGTYQIAAPISALGTMAVYNLDGIGKAIVGASANLYAVVTVAAALTPASTSDFTIDVGILPG